MTPISNAVVWPACVCLLVITEPIKLRFRVWAAESPWNHVLSGGARTPIAGTVLGVTLGHARTNLHVVDVLGIIC